MALLAHIHLCSSFGPPQPLVSVVFMCVWGGTEVWMCMCIPEVDSTCLSCFLLPVHFRYWCRTSHRNLDLASLASQLSPWGSSVSTWEELGSQVRICVDAGDQSQVPMLAQQTRHLVNHHPNSGSSFLFISLWAIPWSFIHLLFQRTLGLPNTGI